MNGDARQQELELPPRASSLVESLRDMGYSLRTALADVIDNSITAGARNIRLFAGHSSCSAGDRHPRRRNWHDRGRNCSKR